MFDSSKRSVAAKQELHDSLGLPLNATTILYAGRLSPEKNVHILGDVLLLLRRSPDNDFKLIIAGDGPSKDKLEKKLKSIAPDSYRFVGHLTEKSDLANLYANVDVFIHPNPREPFGIGPLEAMSSGTPVVAPRSGGILSYCNDNNSWLVDGSPESFANSIFEILAFPDSTHKRVENALINAKSRTWENATDNIFLNYDQMIADFGT